MELSQNPPAVSIPTTYLVNFHTNSLRQYFIHRLRSLKDVREPHTPSFHRFWFWCGSKMHTGFCKICRTNLQKGIRAVFWKKIKENWYLNKRTCSKHRLKIQKKWRNVSCSEFHNRKFYAKKVFGRFSKVDTFVTVYRLQNETQTKHSFSATF